MPGMIEADRVALIFTLIWNPVGMISNDSVSNINFTLPYNYQDLNKTYLK